MFNRLFESKHGKHDRLNEQLNALKRQIKWARKERQERHDAYMELREDPLTTAFEKNSIKRSISLLDDTLTQCVEKMNTIESEMLGIQY
jgi:chromosome segregation ATPase